MYFKVHQQSVLRKWTFLLLDSAIFLEHIIIALDLYRLILRQKMAQNFPATRRAADTCTMPNLDDLRRQMAEIQRTIDNAAQGNRNLKEIQAKCDALQKESVELLSATAQDQLGAQEHLHYVVKRKKEIHELMKELQQTELIDVCFLMDCTNSMEKHIDQVKNYIFNTVALLQTRFPHLNLRLAFVGYRDLNLPIDEQYSILDFTDVEEFHRFVSNVGCRWGRDVCEDVLGGLQKITELEWKQSVRIMIHIGDAPAHGQRYHDLSDEHDDYFTNDSDGSIGYSYIQELIELNVKYFFGRLTLATDKMIEQFRNFTDKKMSIEEIDLNKFESLLPFIVESISKSISASASSLLQKHVENDPEAANDNGKSTENTQRSIVFNKIEPEWKTVKAKRVKVIKYECNEQLQCTEVIQNWLVKIADNPFSEGALRLAYYGLNEYKNTWEKAVFKEFKRNNRGVNTKEKYLQDLDCQTVADYLALEFNKLPQLKGLTSYVKKIKFIMTKLVFMPIGPESYRNMSMERFIDGSYKKFSNNAGYVEYSDPAFTLQAFSHWTHDRTDGNMMVVDLQGIIAGNDGKYLLTDPCIHSIDLLRFGRTNLGKPGMKRFFQTHICNIICHALKLKQNEHQPDIKAAKYDSYFNNKPNRTMFN
ncbi:unnamed protein product [Rotaria magnacalcarata]